MATTGGNLPARHVIHTVGPVYAKGTDKSELLRDCYRNSLRVADEIAARTLAFPLISAGVYGWPKEDAIRQALATLAGTSTQVETATLVLFDAGLLSLAREIHGAPR